MDSSLATAMATLLEPTIADDTPASITMSGFDSTRFINHDIDFAYQQHHDSDALGFRFTLSSTDNTDNLGDPMNTPGVVNITVPIKAFISTVQYPSEPEAIKYGNPAVPYFSLRRSGDSSAYVIGRSFFQEAYLTEYVRATFSIHQALFPDGSNEAAVLETIEQPDGSPYPPPKSRHDDLSTATIAGIAVGAAVAVRRPIDPSRIVFWGPLPDSVYLPHGHPEASGGGTAQNGSHDGILGSNYTEEEETMLALRDHVNYRAETPPVSPGADGHGDDASGGGGMEFVRVPQMAARR
ncbi:uncharacterized protein J7T54_007272 [Emericellopsis cladophorae]|uniref:Uncharacterized protein n=1 Tax=Emericellopsis cladophorae TaxID=2686198 RepID=A0A9P9XZK7_9HYPO|nr:uncharacterized protein J7T54_007272 [Emericellopsis cladophorae]KAI6780423.1 hypothetical protein J7T54_007272 [Emericellopsis cladophorae]